MIIPEKEEKKLKEMIAGAEKDSIALAIVADFIDKCKLIKNLDGIKYDYKRYLKGSTFIIILSFLDSKNKIKKQSIKVNRHDIMQTADLPLA